MPQRKRTDLTHRQKESKKSASGRVEESRPDSTSSDVALHEELPAIVQEHPADAPPGWVAVQENLAAAIGLSVLLVDGRQPPALVASNNNSICHAFQSSMEYVALCDPYCGDAHRRALSAGSAVNYKCHAGLQCFTMPVHIGGGQNLAAIGGRALVRPEDYRTLVDRVRAREPEKTYKAILKPSMELLRAERASLWVFDEESNEISLKAAEGFAVSTDEMLPSRIGEGISGGVLETGKALVVSDLETVGLTAAPADRKYRTKSFISYPITMRGRKIGVLNVADKSGDDKFDDVDLSLLEILGPQIAVALESAEWHERATQFQLMSITDPLTGLLNRRYLEERLTDELNRSERYNYSMSCLMIDIDDFKSYNDRNGHQAGDVALKITAHALKAALRSADVACRYGGEEFCILLPQTSLSEAGVIAERMRQRVAEREYPFGKSQPQGNVTVSIGISTLGKYIDTGDKVIAAADLALYTAKAQGKYRIESYADTLPS